MCVATYVSKPFTNFAFSYNSTHVPFTIYWEMNFCYLIATCVCVSIPLDTVTTYVVEWYGDIKQIQLLPSSQFQKHRERGSQGSHEPPFKLPPVHVSGF